MLKKRLIHILVSIVIVAGLLGGLAIAMRSAQAAFVDEGFNAQANDPVVALVVQPDGKVIVGGDFTELNGQPHNHIGRLNPDGSLDSIFNASTGPNAVDRVWAVALQPDGKILMAGWFGVTRLNPDGSKDTSFNPVLVNPIGVYALAVQVIGGNTKIVMGGNFGGYITRLNEDGTYDSSFAARTDKDVFSIAVQPDGKIVIGGAFYRVNGQPCGPIARLNVDGSLDSTFNPVPVTDGIVYSLAVQPDGKVLASEWARKQLPGQPWGRLVRLNTDGSLDTTFAPDIDDHVADLITQPDGKILVAGGFQVLAGQPRSYLGRLNPDGSLDTSFSPELDAQADSLAIQPDGKIVVGGIFTHVDGQPHERIARINPNDVGAPVVDDSTSFTVATDNCVGGTNATFTITTGDGKIYPPNSSWPNALTESPAGSGHYTALVPPLQQFGMSGKATVKFNITCGGSPAEKTSAIFIDPSGRVTDPMGNPIAGAQVTLLYSPSGSQNGPFSPIPDQNAGLPAPIMSDTNKNNPTTTSVDGFYRWDVIPGWYKVQVDKAGCGSARSAAVQLTAGGSTIPNIDIILDCAKPGVSVQITPMSDWQTGYCRNAIVTNSSAYPVDWKVIFTTDGTINNFWNVIWSQSGHQVTAEGVGWNNLLQPGQSTHSIGFCANR